jgi:hypothetical protein
LVQDSPPFIPPFCEILALPPIQLLCDSVYQILLPAGLGEGGKTLLIKAGDNVLESIDCVVPDALAL